MPGYGYAEAREAVKEDWQGLMFEYLRGRPTLRRVLLLLDARIEVKSADVAVMELLDRAAVTYPARADQGGRACRPRRWRRARPRWPRSPARHPAAHPAIATTSSETGAGIAELRATLAELAAP